MLFTSIQELSKAARVPWDASISFKNWCASGIKLYLEAKSDGLHDKIEESYIKYMKFCSLVIEYLPKHREINMYKREYNDLKEVRDQYRKLKRKKANESIIQLEKIKRQLELAYQKEKERKLIPKIVEPVVIPSSSIASPVTTNQDPKAIIESAKDFIEAASLSRVLKSNMATSVLMVDLRRGYELQNRPIYLNHPNTIYVPAASLHYGIQALQIEGMLSNAVERDLFRRREEFELIVYYDESSFNQQNITFQAFLHAISTFDLLKILKRAPVFLKGGLFGLHNIDPQLFNASTGGGTSNTSFGLIRDTNQYLTSSNQSTLKTMPGINDKISSNLTLKFSNSFEFFQPSSNLSKEIASSDESLSGGVYPKAAYKPTTGMQYPPLSAHYEPAISLKPPSLPPKPSAPPLPVNEMNVPAEDPFAGVLKKATGHVSLGTTGLKNLGNTCFMNASLQCLSATNPLTRYFLDGSYKKHINPTNRLGHKGEVANAYAMLLKNLWSGEFSCFSPSEMKKLITKLNNEFEGNKQHDAHDFMMLLLDGIHEDLNLVKHRSNEPEPEDDSMSDDQLSLLVWKNYLKTNMSIVARLCHGQYLSKTTCNICSYVRNHLETPNSETSRKFTPFVFHSVPVPSKGQCHVSQCLSQFSKAETLDGTNSYFCKRCKQHRPAQKSIYIWRLPEILFIHLNRFVNEGPFRDKSNCYVDFPLNSLEMSHYIPVQGSSGAVYDLYAITNHYGGLEGGHYTAFCYNGYRNQWFNYDDSRVVPVDNSQVITSAAYVLFYVRRSVS